MEGVSRGSGGEKRERKGLTGDWILSPQCVPHWVSPACSRSLGNCWSSPGYVALLL